MKRGLSKEMIFMSYVNILENILDSKDTTAGGGSAAAIAGAMSCGLIGMVARLSIMKCYGLTDSQYIAFAEELDQINFKLLRGSMEDSKSYCNIESAFSLPKDSMEAINLRDKEILEAALCEIDVELNNAQLCKRVIRIGLILKGNSDSNLKSDLETGLELANVALNGSIRTINDTLSLIKDNVLKVEIKEKISYLMEKDDYFEKVNNSRQY